MHFLPWSENLLGKCYTGRVKTDLIPTGAYAQSKARRIGPIGEGTPTKVDPKKLATAKDALSPDYKLDLSTKPLVDGAPSSPTLSLPSLPSVPTPPAPSAPKLDLPDVPKEAAKETATKEIKAAVVEKVKDGSVKKPAILFIKGLDIFSSPSKSERGYAGVGKMADAIEGSKVFSWSEQDKIIDEVRKTHKDYPIILVGHSLGGDTAIEVAEALDSLDHKFRPIDLLVTMDAIGFDHDIIPQNVKQHLNVFGEKNIFLNDGPHVARRHEKTDVKNILSPEEHIDIDDSKEIQYEVVNLIQKALGPGLA